MIQNLSLKEKKTESGLYRYIENQPFTYLQRETVLKLIIYMTIRSVKMNYLHAMTMVLCSVYLLFFL